ncbi:MAG: PilW family protein [Methylobacter sp.]|jgi:type IV pilus assembly protein PilW|nr:PilW family protein [Methylobacter sp.]
MNSHQRGYTLIELMISLLLGLILIAGFGSLFVQTQKNATTQRSLSYMMEDGRYILEVFGRELRRTGSLRSKMAASGGADVVFTPDASVLGSTMSFAAGDYIMGEYNAAGFGATADTPYNINRLTLRYQLNDTTELAVSDPSSDNSPCTRSIHLTTGEDPATQVHVVTLYFYVAFDATTNVPVLYCLAKRQNLTAGTTFPATLTPQPLISNVQQLLITYGIDTDIVADGAANYYVDAGSVPATINDSVVGTVPGWQRVVAAKLSVVLRSDDDNLTKSPVSYTIDGTTYTATDKRFYRVASTTVAFRNKI